MNIIMAIFSGLGLAGITLIVGIFIWPVLILVPVAFIVGIVWALTK